MNTKKQLSEVLAEELTAESVYKLCCLYDLLIRNKENKQYLNLIEAISRDDIIQYVFRYAHSYKQFEPALHPSDHHNSNEVMKAMNISKRTLVEWRKAGILPYIVFRNRFYYRDADLVKLLVKQYTGIAEDEVSQVSDLI